MLDEKAIEHFSKDFALMKYTKLRDSYRLNFSGTYKLLDVGGGSTFSLEPKGLSVNVDISLSLLKLAKRNHPEKTFIQGDARYLPLRDAMFDVVVGQAVLHHLIGSNSSQSKSNIIKAVAEMERARSRDGLLIIYECCPFLKLGTLLAFYITKLLAKLNLEFPWLGIHSNVITYFLTLKQLKSFLKTQGLNPITIWSYLWKIKRIPIGLHVIVIGKK